MKKIQRIVLAFMLGIVPIQSVLADSKATELTLEEIKLFTNGADAYDKNTWLIYAPHMNKESLEAVKYLIDKGADVNAKGSQGRTALMEASRFGRLEVVKYLISKGADVNTKDNNGFTALIIASLEGHLEAVKYLLDKDADINAKNNYGGTALMFASLNGHLEIVKYLISKGADINIKGNNGETALIMASGSGHLDIVKTLVEGKGGILSMFSKGADINAKATIENNGKKAEGVTALIIASMQGHLEVVKYLISKGANVNDKFKLGGKMNMDGGTALIIALMGEHLEIAKYLISKGADVNAKFKTDDEYGKKMDGVTALIWASMNENLEIVKQLINKGADVNAVMSMSAYNFITLNYTALDMATDGKYHKIIEVLKKAGGKFAKEIK